MKRLEAGILIALLGAVGFAVVGGVSSYNRLVSLEERVDAQWGQVENVYQRRADLVPNLVATVKGVAGFESETLTKVIEARAAAIRVSAAEGAKPTIDQRRFEENQAAQDQLGGAISRLLAVVESYPQLGSVAAFRDLMTQLEGAENRIAVERMRFNQAAEAFNATRRSFPSVIVASMFGDRFAARPYFRAQSGAASAPVVRF